MAIDKPGIPAVEFDVPKMLPEVERLAKIGCTESQIRESLIVDFPLLTQKRWDSLKKKSPEIKTAIECGIGRKKNKIATTMWQHLENGNVPVTIFMAKVHLGWKEGAKVEIHQNVPVENKLTLVNTKLPDDPLEASREYQRIMQNG
jgi:hypothetical protein